MRIINGVPVLDDGSPMTAEEIGDFGKVEASWIGPPLTPLQLLNYENQELAEEIRRLEWVIQRIEEDNYRRELAKKRSAARQAARDERNRMQRAIDAREKAERLRQEEAEYARWLIEHPESVSATKETKKWPVIIPRGEDHSFDFTFHLEPIYDENPLGAPEWHAVALAEQEMSFFFDLPLR